MAGSKILAVLGALLCMSGCVADEVTASGNAELHWSDSEAPAMSRVVFDQLMKDVSNWGRWGSDDQLGTLNLITPEVRRKAAELVGDGVSISMALDVDKQQHLLNPFPFEHEVQVLDLAGHRWAGDRYGVFYHGSAHSHLDGLQHVAHKGMLYNGMPIDSISPEGTERLGIQNIGVSGIFARGVLVDFPEYLGIDFVPAGTAISVADLEAWEAASGVTISSGDVLLIRTGRWVQVAQEGPWNFSDKAAGLHASVAVWLRERDVAVLGSDGVSDVHPSGVEGLSSPLHELVIAGLGMPMLDNLELEAVSETAATLNRPVFLFVGSPLRVPGGTGAPLNPLAIF